MKKFLIALVIVLLTSNAAAAFAAGSGGIRGRVTQDGNGVSGAEVLLINEDIETKVTTTNADGYYSFDSLPYGKYLITIKVNGRFYVKYKVKK